MRLASFAAVVTLWFTANNAMTGQQQAQTSQWQAQLAAQSQEETALANAYGQLSSGNAVTRAAVIQKFAHLESEIPGERQHINTLVRNYLWDGLQPNRCTPSEEIPVDVKAAFASTYDDFRIIDFNDGADWATLDCMKRTSADTLEVKWRNITLKGQSGYAEDYSATLHIDKNVLGFGKTRLFLSCSCYELNYFSTRGGVDGMFLTKTGPDATEPYQANLERN